MDYKKHVKYMQRLQIALIALCVLGLLVYAVLMFRPKVKSMMYPDECMPIGGTVSHSVASEDACSNACVSACSSKKTKLQSTKFIERFGPECNYCECFCI
ncbi:MAG: hypothetical protein HGA85_00930 [Nanoarchaeota archaeon]|nr:hypothetical protein [Nanoarchaeota archaeon]